MHPTQRKTKFKIVVPAAVPLQKKSVEVQTLDGPLHQFHDGSTLRTMDARALSALQIWYGQRTLDTMHRARIQKESQANLLALDGSLFHVVIYPSEEDGLDQKYIIDGQHRASVLKEFFETNNMTFTVLVKEKYCKNHDEAVEYFKILNTTKAIEWKEDPKLIATRYLNAILKEFPDTMFRPVKTKRPRIQIEKLLTVMIHRRFGHGITLTPEEFAGRVVEWNERRIESILYQQDRTPLEMEALKLNFALGLDEQFGWLDSAY
jgi:hypothetical protein